ncbi:hypothetical protein ACOWL9_07080 [Helicobacter pylori]
MKSFSPKIPLTPKKIAFLRNYRMLFASSFILGYKNASEHFHKKHKNQSNKSH